jgi:hypothetical protein
MELGNNPLADITNGMGIPVIKSPRYAVITAR